MRFDWQNSHHLEDKNKRTHITKDFHHPTDPDKRIKIQSAGLLHYYDGKNFKNLPDLSFPEGKEIKEKKDKHFIMDLPKWGREELSKDGKLLRIYDKKDQPIYVLKNPFIVSKGVKPYRVVNRTGWLTRETVNRHCKECDIDERTKLKKEVIDESQFEIENHKLYVKIPSELKHSTYPLQIYDDTDTGSTNNKDALIASYYPTQNFGDNVDWDVAYWTSTGNTFRQVIEFTLSSGSGEISQISVYGYFHYISNPQPINLHELTNVFIEMEVTWNKRNSTTDWDTPGGDFSATVVDVITPAAGWKHWDLVGGGADNPIAGLTWGSTIDFLLKMAAENVTAENATHSKDSAEEEKPYIEITYTPPPTGRSQGYIF